MRNSKGFTLIELLIVIAVLGALAAVLISVLNPFQQFKKGRDAQRRSDIKQIQDALEQYYNDNGTYPTTDTAGGDGWVNSSASTANSNTPWIPGLTSAYTQSVPVDPINKGCAATNLAPQNEGASCYTYSYYSSSWCSLSGKGYILVARMENSAETGNNNINIYYPTTRAFCNKWIGDSLAPSWPTLYVKKNP